MKTYQSVSEYIKQSPKENQSHIKEVREIVKATVSDAKETISYGMPAYNWRGKPLFYFAAMKGHLGLYPTSGPIKTLQEELREFSTSKGCIRVPWNEIVPKKIIIKLLRERIKEIKGLV